jgi:hypothetical protein
LLHLSVSGQVEIFANIAPPKVFFRGVAGEPLSKTVKIIPLKKYPFKIKSVHAKGHNNIRYALEEVKRSQGLSYELTVENLKKKKGRYYELISLKTDSDIKPVIKISVVGYIFEPKQDGKK